MNVAGPAISLYSYDGSFVSKVKILPSPTPPELIVAGERFFIRRADGRYTESQTTSAALAYTEPDVVGEIGAMKPEEPA